MKDDVDVEIEVAYHRSEVDVNTTGTHDVANKPRQISKKKKSAI